MNHRPSLLRFIGIAVFMTVVAVFVAGNAPLVKSFQSRLLAYLSVFAATQTTVTYLIIQRWLAESNGMKPDQKGTANSTSGE